MAKMNNKLSNLELDGDEKEILLSDKPLPKETEKCIKIAKQMVLDKTIITGGKFFKTKTYLRNLIPLEVAEEYGLNFLTDY